MDHVLATAADRIASLDDFAETVTYTPTVGDPADIRAIVRTPDEPQGFGGMTRAHRPGCALEVRCDDVVEPAEGDTVERPDGRTYVVRGFRRREHNRLFWWLDMDETP